MTICRYFIVAAILLAPSIGVAGYIDLTSPPAYFMSISPSSVDYTYEGGKITQRGNLSVSANDNTYVSINSFKSMSVGQLAKAAFTAPLRHPVVSVLSAAGLTYTALDEGGQFEQEVGEGTSSESLDCSDGCYYAAYNTDFFYAESAEVAAGMALSFRGYESTGCEVIDGSGNVRCSGQRIDENEFVYTANESTNYLASGSYSCASGQVYHNQAGCVADTYSNEPVYEPIPAAEALDKVITHLETNPDSIFDLLTDFTATPSFDMDSAIYESGSVETHFEGPESVSGTMSNGNTWEQDLSYDIGGVYISPPVVTTPSGDSYIDYSYEPTVSSSPSPSTTHIDVTVDMSGVEQRLDTIIDNTTSQGCNPSSPDYYTCLNVPMSSLPAHSQADNLTFTDANMAFMSRVETAPLSQALNGFSNYIELGSTACPTFSISLPPPIDVNASTDIHCSLMETISPVISGVMIIVYLFMGFRIFASA